MLWISVWHILSTKFTLSLLLLLLLNVVSEHATGLLKDFHMWILPDHIATLQNWNWNQMGILCELLIGKWIHNTLSSLAKFHLCVGVQPGGLGKHFPGQQWRDASRSTAGMSLAGRGANFKRYATLSSRIIDPFTLPGVDPAGWFSTVHNSALNLLLTQSNQHQDRYH